jgi:hypothetical protein
VFTGDVLERVKSQIVASTAIIAVLTGANPNVYLEVGYAWVRGGPRFSSPTMPSLADSTCADSAI